MGEGFNPYTEIITTIQANKSKYRRENKVLDSIVESQLRLNHIR
jgi:hypothetical protein